MCEIALLSNGHAACVAVALCSCRARCHFVCVVMCSANCMRVSELCCMWRVADVCGFVVGWHVLIRVYVLQTCGLFALTSNWWVARVLFVNCLYVLLLARVSELPLLLLQHMHGMLCLLFCALLT